ncbi:hypothetical protein MC885_013946 [Smutsia gigantea]|nr:hypothetical protein MC885_013946 [Smutsia gigantea]
MDREHRERAGLVGISLNCDWGEPVNISSPRDIEAAERYLQFCLGWFANPIYAGDYPQVMKDRIGRKSAEQGLDMSRLPVFSRQDKSYIKGTSDFLGLGHFTTRYITERNYPSSQGPSYHNDRDLVELVDPNWLDLGSKWRYSVPWGFRRLLHFAQFEWEKGYSDRYGLYYVEFNNRNKPRYPKASVQYYKKIITANGFPSPRESHADGDGDRGPNSRHPLRAHHRRPPDASPAEPGLRRDYNTSKVSHEQGLQGLQLTAEDERKTPQQLGSFGTTSRPRPAADPKPPN